jgi:surface protein
MFACRNNVGDFTNSLTSNVSYLGPTTTTTKGAVKFNSDISNWDTSSLEDMQWMFYETESFTGDLSKWNVSKVWNMREIFYHCWEFNSDLSQWDTSSVTSMKSMFYETPKFNSDISNWDTSKVTTFEEMFYGATSFNSDLSKWDLSSGEYKRRIHSLFSGRKWPFCVIIVPLTSNTTYHTVTSLLDNNNNNNQLGTIAETVERMFYGATAFNQNLCAWKDNFNWLYGFEGSAEIFVESGCTYTERPRQSNNFGGPFCASDCAPTMAPTVSSIISSLCQNSSISH